VSPLERAGESHNCRTAQRILLTRITLLSGRKDMDQSIKAIEHVASKVPEVSLGFWIIKILATTLGETGGDTVTMTMDLGYLAGTAIFLAVLVMIVLSKSRQRNFIPFSTGRRSSLRRRSARPWPILPTGLWASAMPAAHLASGIVLKAQFLSIR
jgi:hypothetical protein